MGRTARHRRWVVILAAGLALVGLSQTTESPLWVMKFPPLKGHTGTIWSVTFSPTMPLLASGSTDATVILWGLEKLIRRG